MGKLPKDKCDGLIRYSTDIDLKEILRWLKEQDRNKEVTFFRNRNTIIKSHEKDELLVYIDLETNKPIAYQLGGLITPGILEVRIEKRRQGIGEKLVEYCIKEARENDKCLLLIECNPSTSIPFWKRMGFQMYGANYYAFRLLDKKHNLPEHGIARKIEICFCLKENKLGDDIFPLKRFTPSAVITSDDVVHLSERVSFFDVSESKYQDIVISICIDGAQVYLVEAIDPKAKVSGVKRDGDKQYGEVLYIDNLNLRETKGSCLPLTVNK